MAYWLTRAIPIAPFPLQSVSPVQTYEYIQAEKERNPSLELAFSLPAAHPADPYFFGIFFAVPYKKYIRPPILSIDQLDRIVTSILYSSILGRKVF